MTTFDTADLRAKLAEMTSGPWRFGRGKSGLSAAALAGKCQQVVASSWHHCSEHYPTEKATIANLEGIIALRNNAEALLDRIDEQDARIAAMTDALNKARLTFSHYGDLHAAKPDPVKAQRNYDLADEMLAALSEKKS